MISIFTSGTIRSNTPLKFLAVGSVVSGRPITDMADTISVSSKVSADIFHTKNLKNIVFQCKIENK